MRISHQPFWTLPFVIFFWGVLSVRTVYDNPTASCGGSISKDFYWLCFILVDVCIFDRYSTNHLFNNSRIGSLY